MKQGGTIWNGNVQGVLTYSSWKKGEFLKNKLACFLGIKLLKE